MSSARKKKKKHGATNTGGQVSIRMYNMGFGDCFLLRIPTDDGERRMLIDCGFHSQGKGQFSDQQIVQQIKNDLNGELLNVVVATHRHQDHISGFGEQALWADVSVEEVWLPFTANPDAEAVEPALRAWRGIMASASQLCDANGVLSAGANAALGTRDLQERDAVAFMLWNARSNQPAIDNLLHGFKRQDGRPSLRRFLPGKGKYPTHFTTPVLPSVKIHVLGPPTDPAMRRGKKVPSTWAFDSAFSALPADPYDSPFSSEWHIPKGKLGRLPFQQKSLDAIRLFNDDLMLAARAVDSFLNGESLVLVIEVGKARLLFTGDAEVGAWTTILDNPAATELAASATVMKIGHHGSHNATPLTFVRNQLSERTLALISTQQGPGRYRNGIPLDDLITELDTKHIHYARSDVPLRGAAGGFSGGPKWTDCAIDLVPALDVDARIRERHGEGGLDSRRFTAFDELQVQRRTRQHFDAALQHAAGGSDAGLVLVETLRGRVATHAHIHAMVVAAPVGVVEQYQVDVRAPGRVRGEACRDVVRGGQPADVAHREPLGDRCPRVLPQQFEC
jgi:beta-lactamase superfamily II metal-dependent hydrolase